MTTPLVSVITPASDAAVYLTRAVASVLGQSYWNVEHIVVAQDHLDYEVQLRRAGIHDSRLRVIATDRPGESAASAMNTGLARARGSIIAPLAPTDIFYANRLERLVPLVQSFGVATDNRRIVNEHQRTDLGTWMPLDGRMRTLGRLAFLRVMIPLGLVAQRHHFEPGWPEAVGQAYEVLANLRAVAACKQIPVVPQPLHELRIADTTLDRLTTRTKALVESDAGIDHHHGANASADHDRMTARMVALHVRHRQRVDRHYACGKSHDPLRFLGTHGFMTPSGTAMSPRSPPSTYAA